jgi:RNA polymerase-associated protein RTF1
MDMETSSESESEDGQITKQDLEEEMYGAKTSKKKTADEDQIPATLEDLNKCRITRDMLSKWCMSPWFEEYVKGLCLSQNHQGIDNVRD